MSLKLHKIVQDLIHNVNEFEEIELYLPKQENIKGRIETHYSKPLCMRAQVQNIRYIKNLQDNMPRHIKTCSVYLDKDKNINYINAIIKRNEAFWQIQEIEEEGKTWLKCKAYQQKGFGIDKAHIA